MENKQFKISEDCNFPGVYIILNIDNKKVYIGSTRNIKRRLTEHEIRLRNGNHNSESMQKDYNSGDNFIAYPITSVGICSGCRKDDNLRYFEYRAIDYFESDKADKGYNKKADKKKCVELERIKWAKSKLKSSKNANVKEYHKSEMELFLRKVLKNKL